MLRTILDEHSMRIDERLLRMDETLLRRNERELRIDERLLRKSHWFRFYLKSLIKRSKKLQSKSNQFLIKITAFLFGFIELIFGISVVFGIFWYSLLNNRFSYL